MLENAKSWHKGKKELKITFTAHYFHIPTNVKSVEFTMNTIYIRWDKSTTTWDTKDIDNK